jgi:hypothetical protein
MFSVRRVMNYQGYVHKTTRIALHHRPRQIILRRDALLLLRLVIDSRILINLLTDPRSDFAMKLKVKCAVVHRDQFPWLLDPAYINIDPALVKSLPSILDETTRSGHWVQVEWLMQQAMRPCAAVMDPALSAAREVDKSYLLEHADFSQQPNFCVRIPQTYVDGLPKHVGCNGYRWLNSDRFIKIYTWNGRPSTEPWPTTPRTTKRVGPR